MITFKNKLIVKYIFSVLALLFLIQPDALSQKIQKRISLIKICSSDSGGKTHHLNSPCGIESLLGTISEDSPEEVEIEIAAFAVNIPGADVGSKNSFPENYPSPFLRYAYSPNNYRYTDVLDNWAFQAEIESADGTIDILYKATMKVKVLLPGNIECHEETSTMSFPMDLSLFTYSMDKDQWETYPIFNYTGPDEIFNCKLFHETRHICYPELEADVLSSVDICIECQNDGLDESILNLVEIDKNNQLKILSNPFTEILEYQILSKKESEFTVALYSFDGKIVNNTNIKTSIGQNDFHITSENLKSGIYYLSFVGMGSKLVQKVMCVK